MTSLPNLHDATLQKVSLDWTTATAQLRFKIGIASQDVLIVEAEGVTNLKCPRFLPWGRSNSVNSTLIKSIIKGQLLTIEMQSGDLLEIFCQALALRPFVADTVAHTVEQDRL